MIDAAGQGPSLVRHRLRALDFFSGMNGWSDPFRELATTSSPSTNGFVADACLKVGDIRAVRDAVPWRPDIIFACPPCNAFSTSSIGRMWMRGSPPSSKRSERYPDAHPIAMEGMRLVLAMLRIIAVQQPTYLGH